MPGGKQLFRSDIDEQLGSLWEDAEARLRVATIHAGIRQPIFGDMSPTADPDGQLTLANNGFLPPVQHRAF